jgi:predicted transcriptional regulator
MGKAESVTLDEDVQEELSKLAERSGRPIGVLANAALRDFLRFESELAASIERGVADIDAGRTRTNDQMVAHLQEQRRARRG